MIGGIASRYTGGRFTASGAVADIGFKLSTLYATTSAALGTTPITTSVAGWTTPVTTYAADDYTTVVLPFNVTFDASTTFNTVYLTSNQYIMLGSFLAVTYFGFSATKPAVPKLFLNASDTSWTRVYVKSNTTAVTIRIQGRNANSTSLGVETVYEVTFFNPTKFAPSMNNYNSAIQVVTGTYTAPLGGYTAQGIYTAASSLATRPGGMATGRSYLYLRNSSGNWNIEERYLINETAYAAGEYAYT